MGWRCCGAVRQGCGGGECTDAAAPATLHWACEPASPLGTADAALAAWHTPHPPAVCGCWTAPTARCGLQHLSADPSCPHPPGNCGRPTNPGLTGARVTVAPAGPKAWCPHCRVLSPSWPGGSWRGLVGGPGPHRPCSNGWQTARPPCAAGKTGKSPCAPNWLGRAARSPANYFVATLPTAQCAGDSSAQTANLLAALRQHGIKLRDCTSFGLPGALCLGVLPPASQDALRLLFRI